MDTYNNHPARLSIQVPPHSSSLSSPNTPSLIFHCSKCNKNQSLTFSPSSYNLQQSLVEKEQMKEISVLGAGSSQIGGALAVLQALSSAYNIPVNLAQPITYLATDGFIHIDKEKVPSPPMDAKKSVNINSSSAINPLSPSDRSSVTVSNEPNANPNEFVHSADFDHRIQIATRLLQLVQSQLCSNYPDSNNTSNPANQYDLIESSLPPENRAMLKEITAPLCAKCYNNLIGDLESRCHELEMENKSYDSYMQQISAIDSNNNVILNNPNNTNNMIDPSNMSTSTSTPSSTSVLPSTESHSESELIALEASLSQEEASLSAELDSLEKEEADLLEAQRRLDEEDYQLSAEEHLVMNSYEDYINKMSVIREEQIYLKRQISVLNTSLTKLKQTNAADDAFCIGSDGNVGTINGLRLGHSPEQQQTDWAEISAALGQVALLVQTLARKLNYKFKQYRILPMGSYSKMYSLKDPNTAYELYGTNDLGGLFRWYNKIDTALVYLLACINELATHIVTIDPKFALYHQ
jgi:hypothetical protein